MKKNYLLLLALFTFTFSFATTYTVNNSGQTFTPPTLTITEGDTVIWTIGMPHNVVEVDMATYNANMNTALSGGFTTPFGGGMVVFDNTMVGMHYYVCSPHAAGGMKATINVNALPPPPGANYGPCLDLFFSEYIEGSSNNKALEIYNPTSSTVDLSEYSVLRFSNGGTNANTYVLSGSLLVNDVFVISNPNAALNAIISNSDMTSAATYYNGDDAIVLMHGLDTLDIIGIVGQDPGSRWTVGSGYTKENTLVRKMAINKGTTDWTQSSLEWDVYPQNDTNYIGSHTMSPCVTGPVVSFKTDSFTFNEGDGLIHLDSLLINPAIMTPAGQQFEIHLGANSTADATDFVITAGVPVTLPYTHTISTALFNFTALAVDATLVDDALIEGTEYLQIILRNGAFSMNIGADSILYVTITDNDFAADTLVELNSMAVTKNEADGSFDVTIDYLQSATNVLHTVDLQMITGDVADIDNYSTQTVTFDALSKSVTVNITDDILVEGIETITFALVNATNGLKISSDSIFILTLEDNDVALSDIGVINVNDTLGADSAGVHVKIKGIVNSMDRGFKFMGNDLLEFSIQDATGGITIFTTDPIFESNTPSVGDELEIEGIVSFSNGMVRLENLISYDSLSTGNLVTELVSPTPTDMNESSLIRINGLTLLDPSQWTAAGGSGFTVVATTPTGDTINIRIDRDYSALYNSNAPNSAMIDVIGIANQYDNSAPYDENYQIIPRDLNDIILYPTVSMVNQGVSVQEDAGTVTIDFSVANAGAGPYTVDVELTSGDAADIDNFTTMTAVAISGGTGSIAVTITDDTEIETNEGFEFTITNPSAGLLVGTANKFDLTIEDNDSDGISDINVNELKVYPNPAKGKVVVEMLSNEQQVTVITIVDAIGKIVLTNTILLNNGSNVIELDLTSISQGNYKLNIATEKGNHSENLIVE